MRWDWCACLILFTTFYGTFRGFYQRGFELDRFVFCEGPRTAAAYLGHRVESRSEHPAVVSVAPAIQRRLDALLPKPESLSDGTVYVEWRGAYSGPGGYGHFGLAEFGLQIDHLIEARLPRATDCPAVNKAASAPRVLFDTIAVLSEAWRIARSSAMPVDSVRPKLHPRAALMLSPTVDLETAHVSERVINALRRRGIPIAKVSHSMDLPESAKYVLLDLRARDAGSIRAIFYSRWFTPIDRDGLGYFRSRTDTVFVRCRASVCDGL